MNATRQVCRSSASLSILHVGLDFPKAFIHSMGVSSSSVTCGSTKPVSHSSCTKTCYSYLRITSFTVNLNDSCKKACHGMPESPAMTGKVTLGGEGRVMCFPVKGVPSSNEAMKMEDGATVVRDDLDVLLQVLPKSLGEKLFLHSRREELLEVVLDLGRRPEARFLGDGGGEYLQMEEITSADIEEAQAEIGEFGSDNRAGIEGTLHRISAIRSRKGRVVGLTCRVGRTVTGHVDMIRDLLYFGQSILFVGRPGVGKTTVIREIARVLADELHKRVVIVDTSNEIGGDGDVPHPAIGGARRMQVPDPSMQHKVMVEAVENHMPEVVIVDEIGTEAEALACRTIAERGVMLVGTAHGQMLENIIKNPTLCDLVGGIQTVTLGDDAARARGTQKTVLERKAPPTFPLLIEIRERSFWIAHQTDKSVDSLLQGRRPMVEVRTRDDQFRVVIERKSYENVGSSMLDGDESSSNLISLVGGPRASDDGENWFSKLGYISDKGTGGDRSTSFSYIARRSVGEDYEDETYGYDGSGSGKRGSKRGPRGVRPR